MRANGCRLRGLRLLAILVLLAGANDRAHAEGLLQGDVSRHDRRQTRWKLPRPSEDGPLAAWAIRFSPTAPVDPPEVIDSHPLGACRSSGVRTQPVAHHTALSDALDVVYYDASDPAQVERARRSPTTAVPYAAELAVDPRTGVAEGWQVFARFARIRCLPTRFHFITVGRERLLEYREGAAAWE